MTKSKNIVPDDVTYLDFRPDTWDQAQALASQLSGWEFRGQRRSEWHLETSLNRAFKQAYSGEPIEKVERDILDRFKRRAHHFISSPPQPTDTLEWLALIQHHGGPTRLLDFTKSFYVAAFFAVEEAESEAAVWCLNLDALNETSRRLFLAKGFDEFEAGHICSQLVDEGLDMSAIVRLEPYRLSERLVAQQGLFVAPCSLSVEMKNCLFDTLNHNHPYEVPRYEYDMAHLQLGSFPHAG